MNVITIGLLLILIAIAFVATLVTGLIKLVFFLKQKDAYRYILKYGLIGEIFGVLLMFGVLLFYKNVIDDSIDPENVIPIPFYCMLFGQLIGTIITFRKRIKT